MTGDIVYLASPYSHKDKFVEHIRFIKVCKAAGNLRRIGLSCHAPIASAHPISQICDLPKDWSFWCDRDRAFLKVCKALVVLKLDGWDKSVGVAAELEEARRMSLPIGWMSEDGSVTWDTIPEFVLDKLISEGMNLPLMGSNLPYRGVHSGPANWMDTTEGVPL